LFAFLPITILVFILLERQAGQLQYAFLLAASIGFYAWWDIRFVPLLIGSFTCNFFGGRAIDRARMNGREKLAWILTCGFITGNLALLAVFKYANFFITNVNVVFGSDFILEKIILPLGISFFTFEQISFLVDVYRGHSRSRQFLQYALFVSFFPRLVAGPILRYDEIVPQMTGGRRSRDKLDDLAAGLTIFFIGLIKKSLLADGIAPYASPVFNAAAHGEHLDLLVAWGGVLAYTCQLYFDFSGYSDMAIGAARCFGIRFPMNFFSPYKATNIIDFWRRWHITLSRFLRDYLYIALGGNRRGRARRYANLLITMLLGGLWHGANWTFMAWGGLHGVYLMINHGWLKLAQRHPPLQSFRASRIGTLFGFTVTFVAVVVGWTFFRAPTFAAAFDLIRSMVGNYGIVVPAGLAFALHPIHGFLETIGVRFGDSSATELIKTFLWVLALLVIALSFPSTQELVAQCAPVLEKVKRPDGRPETGWSIRWSPSRGWAIALGVIAFFGLISITHVSEFLYWQF